MVLMVPRLLFSLIRAPFGKGYWMAKKGGTLIEKAEAAKRTMLQDQLRGEKEFRKLVKKNLHAGIPYLKRGEAWEALGELTLASRDFRRAADFFPFHDFREMAEGAAERVERQIAPRLTVSPAGVLRDLPDVSMVAASREVLETILETPRSSLLSCRNLLEKIVGHILVDHGLRCRPSTDLGSKVVMLQKSGAVPRALVSYMNTIRVLTDEAASGEAISVEDALLAGTSLVGLLREVSRTPGQRKNRPEARIVSSEPVADLILVFDSSYQPLPAGLRGSGQTMRQRLYRKGNLFIEINTESSSDLPGLSLAGQVLDSEKGAGRSDVSITLQSGMDTLAETSTNEFGEFSFEVRQSEGLGLVLRFKEDGTVVVPLSKPNRAGQS